MPRSFRGSLGEPRQVSVHAHMHHVRHTLGNKKDSNKMQDIRYELELQRNEAHLVLMRNLSESKEPGKVPLENILCTRCKFDI